MRAKLRPLMAEFVGTFSLVFVASGSVVVDTAKANALGLVGAALAQGLVLAVLVTSLLRASGAHFNPAVTFGLWLASKFEGKFVGPYLVAQLLGATVAALVIRALLPTVAGQITGYGVPRIAGDVNFINAILIEALLTFFLVSAIFGAAVSSDAVPGFAGPAIGGVLAVGILIGTPLSGGAMNPARAFGPALVSMEWVGQAVSWIGPILGSAVASLLWANILLPEGDREG